MTTAARSCSRRSTGTQRHEWTRGRGLVVPGFPRARAPPEELARPALAAHRGHCPRSRLGPHAPGALGPQQGPRPLPRGARHHGRAAPPGVLGLVRALVADGGVSSLCASALASAPAAAHARLHARTACLHSRARVPPAPALRTSRTWTRAQAPTTSRVSGQRHHAHPSEDSRGLSRTVARVRAPPCAARSSGAGRVAHRRLPQHLLHAPGPRPALAVRGRPRLRPRRRGAPRGHSVGHAFRGRRRGLRLDLVGEALASILHRVLALPVHRYVDDLFLAAWGGTARPS